MKQNPFLQPTKYFTNGGKGYGKPYAFPTENYDLRVYHNELSPEWLEKIKRDFSRFVESFQEQLCKENNVDIPPEVIHNKKLFNLYIFEDKEEFKDIESEEINIFGEEAYRWRFIEDSTLSDFPDSSRKEYFINGSKGVGKPYAFPTENYNLRVYYNKLAPEQLKEIEKYFSRYVEDLYKKEHEKNDLNASPTVNNNKKLSNLCVFENKKEFKDIESEKIVLLEEEKYRWRLSIGNILRDFPYSSREEYFINGGKGYENFYTVKLEDYNIEVKCYYNEITLEQLSKIEQTIPELAKNFFEKFPNSINASEKLEIIETNICNNRRDYDYIVSDFARRPPKGTTLGITKTEGSYQGVHGLKSGYKIFISDPSDLRVLKHELAHALTAYAADFGCNFIPKFLVEGIAEHFALGPNLVDLTCEECAELTLEKLEKSSSFLYRAGHAIVNYLQAKHPGLIGQYLTDLRKAKLAFDVEDFPPSFTKIFESLTRDSLGMESEDSTVSTEKIKNLILADAENLSSSLNEIISKWLEGSTIRSGKEISDFKFKLLFLMMHDRIAAKFSDQIKSIQSILNESEDMREWLLQHREQPATNKKDATDLAVVQQIEKELDTPLSGYSDMESSRQSTKRRSSSGSCSTDEKRARSSIDKKEDTHSAIVQRMAGHKELDTPSSSYSNLEGSRQPIKRKSSFDGCSTDEKIARYSIE